MKRGLFAKCAVLLASTLMFTACSHLSGTSGSNGGLSAHGLGSSGGFFGQDAGEMFTTQAPHNQIYLFSYDDSAVNEKYIPSINAQAEYLKSHPSALIRIDGHTDERGSREYNIALGERRADSVASLMRQAGVNRSQIKVVSYGKERPANLGNDEFARAQNRRAELTYEATK
jgi:peptidoglycan-associated lipoprotein